MGLLKKGVTHAFSPQGSSCCICGCSLSKGSTFGIRVFNCGHSTHLHCESEENEPSDGCSSIGCPVCLPKKNSNAKNKSVRAEKGLVTTSTSSAQPNKGISNIQHAHEPEIERPALHQMSRVTLVSLATPNSLPTLPHPKPPAVPTLLMLVFFQFEILSNLQKPQKSLQVDGLPQLRLSPPAIYYEKVQMGVGSLVGEKSNAEVKSEKSNKRWQLKDLKSKGSLNPFPLKSSLFG